MDIFDFLCFQSSFVTGCQPGARNDMGKHPNGPQLRFQSISPVDRLTTGWHRAPVRLSIPRGITAILDVINIEAGAIKAGPVAVSLDPQRLIDSSIIEETQSLFFRLSSFGELRVAWGRYRTSVDRELRIDVDVPPAGCAPLIEWRVDEKTALLGTEILHEFMDVGVHTVSAGSPNDEQEIEAETYIVSITSHEPARTSSNIRRVIRQVLCSTSECPQIGHYSSQHAHKENRHV